MATAMSTIFIVCLVILFCLALAAPPKTGSGSGRLDGYDDFDDD